nr:uncharacterized protein LOC112026305 [Quercus suber]
MSAVPSQAESRPTTPYQLQPNQAEGANEIGAGPQPPPRIPTDNANTFIEVLQALQHSQQQMMEEIRQLKTDRIKEKRNQHDPEHGAEETLVGGVPQNSDQHFITMAEVATLLEQGRARGPKERFYTRRPPYPLRVLSKPYPERYEPQVFTQYDGKKGSAVEHVSKFIDTLGPYAADEDLCLREFFKSLCDRAYTWYIGLKPGSIPTWDDMVDVFCTKYFHGEETVTLATMQATKQRNGEDLMEYIKRFRDIALDCYDHCEEKTLVEMCMTNMIREYRAVLENLEISQFAQLLQKARKTAQSLKPSTNKRSAPQAIAISTSERRRKTDGKEYDTPPPIPCTAKELDVLLDKWIADGVFKPNQVAREPTEEERRDLRFCRLHNYVQHATAEWDDEGENPALPAVAITTLQQSSKFKNLFDQLGLTTKERKVAIEALVSIASGAGVECLSAEVQDNRALLQESTEITFSDEDMEVGYLDHRRPLYLAASINHIPIKRALIDTGASVNLIPLSILQVTGISDRKIQGCPMEVTRFGGRGEYTAGHIQLWLKVGPIASLARFHVVKMEVSYHVLLGRPWLHKHRLVPSTYHQCVKGRMNGRMVCIAANHSPFKQAEAHLVKTIFYDQWAPSEENSVSRPQGTFVPKWRDIQDDPEPDLKELLARKRKRKEAPTTDSEDTPHCVRIRGPNGRIVYKL